jgi:hypothetical protein
MTEQQKRVKIAEACGWKRLGPIPEKLNWGAVAGAPYWYFTHELPDYFRDLNTWHEIEMGMSDKEYVTYCITLNQLWIDANKGKHVLRTASATATQRAEAFGKTKGLW